ncbi:MAG TPA: autotransporter outer membrane beta-barrel domain-containing protein [Xanthobacteraceae bacterium]
MASLKINVRLINPRLALGLAAVALPTSLLATPARALNPGCTCPARSAPVGANQCYVIGIGFIPATCTAPTPTGGSINQSTINQSVAHAAASQQQLSFWGVRAILEGRRDQLQGTLGAGRPTAMISGYAASELDGAPGALSYAGQRANPLATPAYKAPPAPASTGPSFATWTQGLADFVHDDAASDADLTHVTRIHQAQGGFDGTWQNVAGGALVVGLLGTWTGAHVSYDGTATSTKLEGPGTGLYGTYVNGGFSLDVTTKFDFLHLTEDFAGLAPANAVNLTNAGVNGNAQYKAELKGGSFVEPTAGFSFTRTMFGAAATAIGLADASTLRLQAGARFGTTWDFKGVSVEPSLRALVYSNVIADGSAATNAGAAGIVPTDQGKVRGELDPDVNWNFGNGYSGTLWGAVRFGQGMRAGAAILNLRKQW